MAQNEVFKHGQWLPLPVTADTPSGSPVVVGGLVGVAQTAEGEGGNVDGEASVALEGVFEVTVTGAVTPGAPVYITAAYAVNVTRVGNKLFGHSLDTKGAAAGVVRVRLAGHNSGIVEA